MEELTITLANGTTHVCRARVYLTLRIGMINEQLFERSKGHPLIADLLAKGCTYHNMMPLHTFFGAGITTRKIDGRTRYAKGLPWYTAAVYFENL